MNMTTATTQKALKQKKKHRVRDILGIISYLFVLYLFKKHDYSRSNRYLCTQFSWNGDKFKQLCPSKDKTEKHEGQGKKRLKIRIGKPYFLMFSILYWVVRVSLIIAIVGITHLFFESFTFIRVRWTENVLLRRCWHVIIVDDLILALVTRWTRLRGSWVSFRRLIVSAYLPNGFTISQDSSYHKWENLDAFLYSRSVFTLLNSVS